LRSLGPAPAMAPGRVAGHARDALALEHELAAADLSRVLRGQAVQLDGLLALPEPRQRAALRAWLRGLGLAVPPQRTLAALRHDVSRAAEDRVPTTRWPGVAVHRYRGHLHAERTTDAGAVREGDWRVEETTRYEWRDHSALELMPAIGEGLARDRLPARLVVRRRRGGESWCPAGGAHRRELRKWLQEQGVLPWRRDSLPLLLDDSGEVVAVADFACAASYAARPGEPSWRVVWHRDGASTAEESYAAKWRADPPFG
jgi:tRNA(Ile)-lysidine synthase